ncbi:type II secretion system F family protein [Deltaproteobacteria bacterium IMCC39524]|nr:type II secretion system F family protein [Deltaproteobacteria bacterium IMCC39524]
MDKMTIFLYVAVFIFTAAVIQVIYLAWMESRFIEKRKIKKRLMFISAGGKHGQEKLDKYRKGILKDVGAFERLVFSIPRLSNLDNLLIKVKMPINATLFILLSLTLGFIGFGIGYLYLPQPLAAIFVGLVCMLAPYFILKLAEKNYYKKFNDQLPEALDLLARAVRSGSALSAGLGMIGEETQDPIRSEFAATVDEINLGLTMTEAMENLCQRVPIADLRFFSIAILVQKETGGNIGEILNNISRLIRERIEFKDHVAALTAEGRLSAIVLIGLPIFMFIYMYLTNYDYLSLLLTEKLGHYMIFGAIVLMIIGSYVIKRIVDIDI